MLTTIQKERLSVLIADLRANPELQGKDTLRPTEDTFCCLGRACNIYNPDLWQFREVSYGFLDREDTLPSEVREWYGFPRECGLEGEDFLNTKSVEDYSLTFLNDEGFTFPMIADIIQYWRDNN